MVGRGGGSPAASRNTLTPRASCVSSKKQTGEPSSSRRQHTAHLPTEALPEAEPLRLHLWEHPKSRPHGGGTHRGSHRAPWDLCVDGTADPDSSFCHRNRIAPHTLCHVTPQSHSPEGADCTPSPQTQAWPSGLLWTLEHPQTRPRQRLENHCVVGILPLCPPLGTILPRQPLASKSSEPTTRSRCLAAKLLTQEREAHGYSGSHRHLGLLHALRQQKPITPGRRGLPQPYPRLTAQNLPPGLAIIHCHRSLCAPAPEANIETPRGEGRFPRLCTRRPWKSHFP